jgi:glycerophosphoryl diester phosphodiesterase
MLFAFFRLFFLFFMTVAVFAGGVFLLRQAGLQTQIAEHRHPLLQSSPWVIADGGDSAVGSHQSWRALKSIKDQNHRLLWFGLHLRQTLDGEWVLYAPTKLEQLTTGSGFVNQSTLAQIKKFKFKETEDEILTLSEALEKIGKANYLIEINQPANASLKKIYDAIDKNQLTERVVISSRFADVTREARNQSGRWLTDSATNEIHKIRFLNSLFLETAVDIPGDTYRASVTSHPRLLSELIRRQKVIIFDESETQMSPAERVDKIKSLAIKRWAILTTRPNNYLQLVDPPQVQD